MHNSFAGFINCLYHDSEDYLDNTFILVRQEKSKIMAPSKVVGKAVDILTARSILINCSII